MNIELEEIYEKISKETGVSKSKVEMAFRSVFEMVAETMREGKGDNILLPKFGKFVVPLRKLKSINNEKFDREVQRYYKRMVELPDIQHSEDSDHGFEKVGKMS
jgi:nucleoid DNA-binding protein